MYPQFDFRLSTLEVWRLKKVWSRGLPRGQLVAMTKKKKTAASTENKVNSNVQQPSQWGRNKTVLSLLRVICICRSFLCQ